MKTAAALLAALALQLAGAAFAQDTDHAGHRPAPTGTTAEVLADGEVRKVDKDARKLTIRHGPLPALDMPAPMTMVYGVKDPALLEQVRPGDKIRFAAEKAGGQFIVIRIEPAK